MPIASEQKKGGKAGNQLKLRSQQTMKQHGR